MSECPLCRELIGIPTGVNADYDEVIRRGKHKLFSSDNFVVIPSIGALCVGHVLIVAKQHVNSGSSSGAQGELYGLIRYVRGLVRKRLGMMCIAFEHSNGNGLSCRSACVDHAHVHVLPSKRPLSTYLNGARVAKGWYEVNRCDSECGYTYLMDTDDSELVIDVSESQFFRRLWCVANEDGRSWNWRTDPRMDNVQETIDLFTAWPVGN